MSDLPTGTVTFLFTDIEGSTKLWELFPEAMRAALAHHDEILNSAITTHQGHVIKTMGDGFHAVFASANDALTAVVEAQLALHADTWPYPVQVRVRMALHSGEAQLRDGDYYGSAVNRAARLMAVGHGGQVLVSGVTHGLLGHTVAPDISLRNLGAHRFKDLQEPEVVWQVCHPGLPADFPPLKSLDPLRTNLPRQLTSFIGREKQIAEVTALLEKSSLLTLVGAGGCGKTRLSLQVAAEVIDQFPDGVWSVELAPLTDLDLVPQSVAQAMEIRDQAGQSLQQCLIDSLRNKCLLLLLDNCEHLLNACAVLMRTLLRACPSIKILATSREALGIGGEQIYRVPSLSVPDSKQPCTPDTVSQFEAVRLFIERARLVKPEFDVTHQDASPLAHICSRLEGIALAIELAAARVRSLTVEDIHDRLDQRFRLLTGGDRTALPRQQTLRALIDWSYDLLNNQERILFARISVFAGGCTLAAAEHVCSDEGTADVGIDKWEVINLLTSLADKSLVIAEERAGSARYRLLETVRQYAAERLQARGEMIELCNRHRDWCVALAEEAAPHLYDADQVRWLDCLEGEHDNRPFPRYSTLFPLQWRPQVANASITDRP